MYYVSNTHTNLLGAEWITNLKMYSMMDTLPSMDPGQPEDTLNTSVIASNDDIAAQLQRQFPEAFSTDLGLYRHSEATLQLKPGAKPVFRPKQPEPATLIAQSASGDRIRFSGQRQCNYSFNGISAPGMFHVANTHTNLLGAEWITNLKMYSMMDTLPSMDPGQPEDTLNTSFTIFEHSGKYFREAFNQTKEIAACPVPATSQRTCAAGGL
ncbi:unnamed protein product [Heligmosomoides polygyrus]|uniref:BPI2 domain-containing protein n=1 Tax=Heligmosomoides polygyrus TaxID=6339 RepID=A0A183GRK6_HELPZ|nr:unnamed protein product [Heligmosomoides polygyrus]